MSNNDAFTRGFTENTYTGNGSDWSEWQRGQMMRQEEERRRREQEKEAERLRQPSAMPGYMPSPAVTTSPATTMSPEEASALFRFLMRVLTLPMILAAALMALFAAPLMRVVERVFGSEEHLDFGEAYKATYKATYAWALTSAIVCVALYALAFVAPSMFRYPAGVLLGVVHSITGPDTLHLVTLPQIVLTIALIQLPALAAFALMLRRTSEHAIFAGVSGFARGVLTAVALLPVSALLGLVLFGVLFKVANTVFHFV